MRHHFISTKHLFEFMQEDSNFTVNPLHGRILLRSNGLAMEKIELILKDEFTQEMETFKEEMKVWKEEWEARMEFAEKTKFNWVFVTNGGE